MPLIDLQIHTDGHGSSYTEVLHDLGAAWKVYILDNAVGALRPHPQVGRGALGRGHHIGPKYMKTNVREGKVTEDTFQTDRDRLLEVARAVVSPSSSDP